MRKIPHGWTKETLGRCAETFMDIIQHYFWSYSGKYRDDNIDRLLQQYCKIRLSVAKGLDYYEKEDK